MACEDARSKSFQQSTHAAALAVEEFAVANLVLVAQIPNLQLGIRIREQSASRNQQEQIRQPRRAIRKASLARAGGLAVEDPLTVHAPLRGRSGLTDKGKLAPQFQVARENQGDNS